LRVALRGGPSYLSSENRYEYPRERTVRGDSVMQTVQDLTEGFVDVHRSAPGGYRESLPEG